MIRKILYTIMGLILGAAICLIFLRQAKINFGDETTSLEENGVSIGDSLAGRQEPIPSLADFEGTWHAVRYEKDNVSNIIFDTPASFAEQYSRYATFTIYDDSLNVADLFGQKVYIKSFPSKLTGVDNFEQTPFVLHFKPESEQIHFIAPKERIYKDICSEGYDALYIHNDQLVITDMGYFFYFERGKLKSDYGIRGIPGDERNGFGVIRVFENYTLDEVYTQFLEDFPYEKEFFRLPKLPLEDYTYETEDGINVYYENTDNGIWQIMRFMPQNVMINLTLTYKEDNVVRLWFFWEMVHN